MWSRKFLQSDLYHAAAVLGSWKNPPVNRDPSLVFFVFHIFMSLTWFLYPRASSGILTQESKCGTPVTASSSSFFMLPFVYVRACTETVRMCAQRFTFRGIHDLSRLWTCLYARVSSSCCTCLFRRWSFYTSQTSAFVAEFIVFLHRFNTFHV